MMNPQHLFQIIYTMTEQDRRQISQGDESATRYMPDLSLRVSAVAATVLGRLYDFVVALSDRFKHEPRPSTQSQTAMRQNDEFTALRAIAQASKADN